MASLYDIIGSVLPIANITCEHDFHISNRSRGLVLRRATSTCLSLGGIRDQTAYQCLSLTLLETHP
jgi:hypothetical protein